MIKHNRDFLLAVHTFTEGGDGADLIDAIHETKPSHEDMWWVLNIHGADVRHKELCVPQSAEAFVDQLSILRDKREVDTADSLSVAPQYNDDTRGDQAIKVRKRKDLGMGKRDTDAIFPKSDGTILYEALKEEGWISLHELCQSVEAVNKHIALKFLRQVACTYQLQDEHICFPRGTHNYNMIAPRLSALFIEQWEQQLPLPLLPMQAGERVISNVNNLYSMKSLFAAITAEFEARELSPEIAFPTRKHPRDAHPPKCMTTALQKALVECGVITNLPTNVHRLILTSVRPIPKEAEALRVFASNICDRVIQITEQQKLTNDEIQTTAESSAKWTSRTADCDEALSITDR